MQQHSPLVRWLVVWFLAVVWIGVVLARLTYLQLICYSEYLARAQRQQQRIVEVTPKRSTVYDRKGRVLAMSIPVDSSFADPSEISDAKMVARLVSGVLGMPAEKLEEKLAEPRTFVWIARKLAPDVAQRIEALNLRGVYFQKENQRFYPQRTLASHVIGYVDVDEHGLAGVEFSFDKQIRGRPGRMLVLADARRRWYDRTDPGAEAGASIVLTLDETIQYIAEKELATAISETHAKSGTVVVQEPNSGELLAVANWPAFDANNPSISPEDARMDRAVSAAYEPGSTFKLITLGGALEHGVTRPTALVDCQMGSILVAGRLIHDWHPFGILTVEEVLAHSSDVGAIKIALQLGSPLFYETIRRFHFGEPTGIELPGENHGLFRRLEDWTASSIGSLAIGQEISVTPIQMVSAVSAIANGGLLYRPRVMKAIKGPAGVVSKVAQIPPPPNRVFEPTTAATLREMMESVILEGTGKPAQLNGYTVAGKSGTAQKIDPSTGRYSRTQYMASFVGFAPVNEPVVTILVVLDSPVGPHHGGEVAGPVFRRIAEQALAYLEVPHDLPTTPEVEAASRNRGGRILATQPRSQILRAARVANSVRDRPRRSVVAPTVAFGGDTAVVVPALLGETVRSVTEECSQLGLTPILIGSGVAVEQRPSAGVQLPRGSVVTVRFGREAAAAPIVSGGSQF